MKNWEGERVWIVLKMRKTCQKILETSLNLFTDHVIRGLGYPREVLVECIEPPNYLQSWTYSSWLHGIWSNVGNVTDCLQYDLCYDPPPAFDFTVISNYTQGIPYELNSTISYSCRQKC